MKQRILTLSLVFLFAVATVFTGCKKDDSTTTTPTPTPTVSLKSDAGYTATSTTVAPGTKIKFAFVAVPVSGSKITGFKVTYSADGAPAVVFAGADTSNLSATSLTREYNTSARTSGNTDTYTVIVTDKNGQTASSSFTLTIKAAGAITTESSQVLGAQGNATLGSFYATKSPGTVYHEADAQTNSGAVDFAYIYDVNNMATLASIDDASTGSTFPKAVFTTKNATKLTLTNMTAADFGNISDDSKISAQATPTTSSVVKLAIGNVVAFETAAHKKGLILINSIGGTNTGSINITVKVQQ